MRKRRRVTKNVSQFGRIMKRRDENCFGMKKNSGNKQNYIIENWFPYKLLFFIRNSVFLYLKINLFFAHFKYREFFPGKYMTFLQPFKCYFCSVEKSIPSVYMPLFPMQIMFLFLWS